MKNEVVVKPTYTRYKLYNERRFKKGALPKGSSGFCFEDDKSLSFISFNWCSNGPKAGFKKTSINKNKLLYKNNKLNIFSIKRSPENILRIRNVSRNGVLLKDLSKRSNKNIEKRTIKILRNFLEKKNIEYKWDKDLSLNKNLLLLLYPSLKKLNIKDFTATSLPSIYSIYFRQPTLQLAIKKCFSSKGKKLQKLLYKYIEVNKDLDIFALGAYLRGIIPLDNILKIIESEINGKRLSYLGSTSLSKVKDVRDFLKNYNSQKIFNLIYRINDNPNLQRFFRQDIFTDTIKMYSEYKSKIILPKHPKDFREIHDYLSKEILKIRSEPIEVKYSDKIKELDGLRVDDMMIELPSNTHVLIDWGQKMNNCIGGYQRQLAKNEVLLLGIHKDNKLVYNISIRSKGVEQFYGNYNSQPDKEDKEKIIKMLEEKNIIFKEVPFPRNIEFPAVFNHAPF